MIRCTATSYHMTAAFAPQSSVSRPWSTTVSRGKTSEASYVYAVAFLARSQQRLTAFVPRLRPVVTRIAVANLVVSK